MTAFRTFMIMVGMLVVCSCGTPPQIIHETSKPVKPKWIDTPPANGNTLYFVGIKTGASTMEEARESATKDALSQVAGYIRSDVSSDFKDFTTEIESKLTSNITSESFATIQGAEVVDTYFEKTARIEKTITLESINFFTLVRFSKEEALKELTRQKQEREKSVQLAYQSYLQGKAAEKSGDLQKSLTLYTQARNLITGIKESIELKGYEFATSKALLQGLDNSISEVRKKAHSVTVSCRIKGDEEIVKNDKVLIGPFIKSLHSILSDRGFPYSDTAEIKIEGEVLLRNTGMTLGNYVCFAECTFTAYRAVNREVLTHVIWKEKTLDKDLVTAINTGMFNAANSVGDSLATKLLLVEQER